MPDSQFGEAEAAEVIDQLIERGKVPEEVQQKVDELREDGQIFEALRAILRSV